MKKILLSLVAMMIATMSFAQSSQLATLSHEGTISTFYGTNALKEALAKADNGDAITLSAGQFVAADITKAVTLRGAGMKVNSDETNSHESTIVQGAFKVNIVSDVTERLIIEGLYFTSGITYSGTLNNAQFIKSRFYSINYSTTSDKLVNCSLIHCRIASEFKLGSNSSANLINCVVTDPYNINTTASNFEIVNCVVLFKGHYSSSVISSYYKNCIILQPTSSNSIPNSCNAINCVGYINGPGNLFSNLTSKNTTNKHVDSDSLTKLFKTFTTASFSYSDDEMFELTDEAKTKYLGFDGTEVGIYGGNLPFEEDPTTPQITKCNVAAKSTADGKLSVDIEVKAAEY